MITFLNANTDVFAWNMEDIPGISRKIITHSLNIKAGIKPKAQARRPLCDEKAAIVEAEVQKLLKVGFIRESHYPVWIANTVIVPKKNGKWRVCVDFTTLNKACPKDSFPLPRISQLVDSIVGHERMSFLDACSGYNQIKMDPKDEEHTSFFTPRGLYCYTVMPFGLKNAGATFQRLVSKIFHGLDKTVGAYIDDLLIKSIKKENHIKNLEEAFDRLRIFGLRLNPEKCLFGVACGKFLGYIIHKKGISADPAQIKAILGMESPKTIKDIQVLSGKIAALHRFVSRASDKVRPFTAMLKGKKEFEWTVECQTAFDNLKQYLTSPPMLSVPEEGEMVYVYLAVSKTAISSVLVRQEGEKQYPVYYLSRTLQDTETRYTMIEKYILALLHTARKQRPYFQAHPITVISNVPIEMILGKPDVMGRIGKWRAELSEFHIEYERRTAIKAQVLADILVEFPVEDVDGMELDYGPDRVDLPVYDEVADTMIVPEKLKWTICVDGSSNSQGAGVGVVVYTPEGGQIEQSIKFTFKATNNEAEYEAVLAGLRLAGVLGLKEFEVISDSKLIIGQINGDMEARDNSMKEYLEVVQRVVKELGAQDIRFTHRTRENNLRADALAGLASSLPGLEKRTVQVEVMEHPSIYTGGQLVAEQQNERPWYESIKVFIEKGKLPENKAEARAIVLKSTRYIVLQKVLYRKGVGNVFLRCVTREGLRLITEIHEGSCSMHLATQTLVGKIKNQGYYWPTMHQDCGEKVRSCRQCQFWGPKIRAPTQEMKPIVSPWPFMRWGMDIVGPIGPENSTKRYFLLATDYFTKWIEGETYKEIKQKNVIQFIERNIIHRFGVPAYIVTDRGPQFMENR